MSDLLNSTAARPLRPAPLALVCTELRVGGAERCVVRLATRIDRRQFMPLVISLAPCPPPGEDSLVTELRQHEVAVEFLNVDRGRQFLAGRHRLRELLVEGRIAVAQSLLFHANMLLLASAPAELPVATGIRVADPRAWRRWSERLASRRAARIVCVSQSVADFCRRNGFDDRKLRVIPNGIDVAAYPAPPCLPPALAGRRMLLCVGRLHHQKGLDWLLSWLADPLRSQLPEHDLAVAGDGPEREPLQQQARQLGIADRVHLLGQQTDVPGLLAAADVLLLPSRWEGMPNVVMEAMAAGRPVLAAPAEGVLELLGDELAALQTAAFGDCQRWCERLLNLVSDRDLAASLGSRNQLRVQRHFSLEQMLAQYQQLWTRMQM